MARVCLHHGRLRTMPLRLEPDIVLIQEWRQGGAERLKAWFDEHVPRRGGWHVSPVTKRGVAVVSGYAINELGVYEWMEGRDKPRKENDDNCDALRYGTMYLDSGVGQLEVRVFGGNDSDDDWADEDWGWR